MGKFNEIQEETKQSFGNNSFTTKIANDAVEFDSAADQFKFLDPIDAPGITINGEEVKAGDQVQADWSETDTNSLAYIAHKPVDANGNWNLGGSNTVNGTFNIVSGTNNTMSSAASASTAVGTSNSISNSNVFVSGSNNSVSATNGAIIGGSNNTVSADNSVILGSTGRTLETQNTTMVTNFVKNGYEIMPSTTGVTTTYKYEKADLNQDATERSNWALYAGLSWYNKAIIKLAYCVTTASPSTITAQVKNFQGLNVSLTVDGQWHEIIIDNPYPKGGADFNVEDAVSGDIVNIIATVYVA